MKRFVFLNGEGLVWLGKLGAYLYFKSIRKKSINPKQSESMLIGFWIESRYVSCLCFADVKA